VLARELRSSLPVNPVLDLMMRYIVPCRGFSGNGNVEDVQVPGQEATVSVRSTT